MKKLNLGIVEVENGYIVTVYPNGRNGSQWREYVAHTQGALAILVTDLAQEASKEDLSDGEVQEPKA